MDKVLMRLELSYNTGKEKTKVINIPMNLTINDLESIITSKLNLKGCKNKKLNFLRLNEKIIHEDQKNYQLSSIKLSSSKLSLNLDEIIDYLTEETYEENLKSISNFDDKSHYLPQISFNFLQFDQNQKGFINKICRLGEKKFIYQEVSSKSFNKFSIISYPNISKMVANIYNSNSNNYFHMGYLFDYFEGESLEEKINTFDCDRDKWKLLFKLLEMLEYMHKMKVHHGNIHPKNIIVTSSGEVHLKLICEEYNSNNLNVYSPPELFSSGDDLKFNNDFTWSIDIWSFGCLVYFIFTKTHPWKNNLFFAYENISKKNQFYNKDLIFSDVLDLCNNHDSKKRIDACDLKLKIWLKNKNINEIIDNNNLENVSNFTKESNDFSKNRETNLPSFNLIEEEKSKSKKNISNLLDYRNHEKLNDSNVINPKTDKRKNSDVNDTKKMRKKLKSPLKGEVTCSDSDSDLLNLVASSLAEEKISEKFKLLKDDAAFSLNLSNLLIDDKLCGFISKNLNLYSKNKILLLNLSKNNITPLGFATIFKNFIQLETLNISYNDLNLVGCKYLSSFLGNQSNLKKLILEECGICDEGFKRICSQFKNLDKLTELNISKNKIRKIIKNISQEINSLKSLECLNMSDNIIKAEGFVTIYEEIYTSQTINKLLFSNVKIGKCAMKIFDSFKELDHLASRKEAKLEKDSIKFEFKKEIHIQFLNRLKTIDIAENNIGKHGAYLLANALEFLINLEILDLFKNNILSSGLKAMCEKFNNLSNLHFLNLGSNNIDDMGVFSLTPKLQYLNKLQALNLHENIITSFGINNLSSSFKYMNKVQTLNLSYNKIDDEGIKEISNNIYSLTYLKFLHLSGNEIRDEGLKHLTQKFKYIPFLIQLRLSSNKITGESIIYIADNIQYLKNLRKLDLSDNQIDDDSKAILAKKQKEDLLIIY